MTIDAYTLSLRNALQRLLPYAENEAESLHSLALDAEERAQADNATAACDSAAELLKAFDQMERAEAVTRAPAVLSLEPLTSEPFRTPGEHVTLDARNVDPWRRLAR